MTLTEFSLRLGCAILCGCVIGAERQWKQRIAGLRTYTLVTVGSALFVTIAGLTPGDSSPTRVAGQIVTGIGFIGAGVIMHSGLSVRGLNTAGTIWCSSAIGTLAGSGFYWPAIFGAAVVVGINTLLQPVAALINQQPMGISEQEFQYSLELRCHARQENQIRALLVQLASAPPLTLHELKGAVGEGATGVILQAVISSTERVDAQIEQIVARMGLEKDVSAAHWRLLPPGKGV